MSVRDAVALTNQSVAAGNAADRGGGRGVLAQAAGEDGHRGRKRGLQDTRRH